MNENTVGVGDSCCINVNDLTSSNRTEVRDIDNLTCGKDRTREINGNASGCLCIDSKSRTRYPIMIDEEGMVGGVLTKAKNYGISGTRVVVVNENEITSPCVERV